MKIFYKLENNQMQVYGQNQDFVPMVAIKEINLKFQN